MNNMKNRKKLMDGSGKLKALFLVLLSIVLISNAKAQNNLVNSTLNEAKKLRNEKEFAKAATVLGNFEKKYPGNIWVEKLYAQTLFWMKDYRQSEVIYKRAIGFHPDNLELKYDYATMLFAEDKLNQAKKQLLIYSQSKNNNAGVEALLGKIYYYQSQFKNAEAHLQRSAQLNPGNKEIIKLYRQVFRIVSPQLLLNAGYMKDDQPLQSFGSALKFQWYVSDMLNFDVSGSAFNYTDIPNTGIITTAEIGNRFHFRKAGLQLRVAGAWFYANSNRSYNWGGTVQLNKKIGKIFNLALEARRTNYTNTIASVNNNLLMINQFSLDFTAGKTESWNGMAGARYQFFPDNNYVDAFYAWFLSKPFHFSDFNLAFGYAFNYMNSKEDRFELKATSIGGSVGTEGIYVPYYTPHNQYANSILVNLNYHAGAYSVFYGHASVGVYSKTYAPGFSLSKNGTPEKTYAYQKYTPLDLGLRFQTDISRKVTLSLDYTYLQTYYYSSHNVNFIFRFYF